MIKKKKAISTITPTTSKKLKPHEAQLQKARQWILTYDGSRIVHAYRKRFKVDMLCALNDLGEIGALDTEKLAVMKKAEQNRLEKRRREKEEKKHQAVFEQFPNSDEQFFFIAGYTSGGAPYGVTWEEYENTMADDE